MEKKKSGKMNRNENEEEGNYRAEFNDSENAVR